MLGETAGNDFNKNLDLSREKVAEMQTAERGKLKQKHSDKPTSTNSLKIYLAGSNPCPSFPKEGILFLHKWRRGSPTAFIFLWFEDQERMHSRVYGLDWTTQSLKDTHLAW